MPKPEIAQLCFEALITKLEQTQPISKLPKQVGHTMMLFRSLYPQLSGYFEECSVQPNDWIQGWLQFLLARELPMASLLRLWDTYFAEGHTSLHMYAHSADHTLG
jgi:hypothetical protein